MAMQTYKVNSIFEGQAPSQYFGIDGTFIVSRAIDPDFPISSSDIKTSGFCVPIGYSKFSGSNVTSQVVAIINTPKDTKTYVVLSNGRLISYDNALSNETLIGTVTGSTAGGACYYNNYNIKSNNNTNTNININPNIYSNYINYTNRNKNPNTNKDTNNKYKRNFNSYTNTNKNTNKNTNTNKDNNSNKNNNSNTNTNNYINT